MCMCNRHADITVIPVGARWLRATVCGYSESTVLYTLKTKEKSTNTAIKGEITLIVSQPVLDWFSFLVLSTNSRARCVWQSKLASEESTAETSLSPFLHVKISTYLTYMTY
jgi:hypothetical protein